MASNNIVLPKNFDANEITFDVVKKNAMGGNVVYFKYEGHPKIIMQTPVVSVPFGLSTYTDDKTGAVKYSLDISFRGMDEDPKIQDFHDKMNDFDNFLIDTAVANSKEWFGKKQSKEVIENFYRPLVKPSKDPSKYAPTMKFKIILSGMELLMLIHLIQTVTELIFKMYLLLVQKFRQSLKQVLYGLLIRQCLESVGNLYK